MLRVEGLSLAVGGRDLLIEADLHVHPGEKVGLVGRNGAGKTSLLRAIVGELSPDEGTVRTRGDAVIGWLPQTAVSGSTKTLWDEARSRMTTLDALRQRLETAEHAIERGEAGAVERLDEAAQAFRIAGGYAVDERIGEVLHGLGFRKDDWHRTCDTFSGGWQMRIALARLLLSESNLLLLDEPTNHLDIIARSWLSKYLEKSPHTVLLVSHDRHLLDLVCRRIVEVQSLDLESYMGNYTSWMRQRELRRAQQEVAFERQQTEIARLEGFVERFGAKATKASQAQARQKRLDAMERLEAPDKESRPKLTIPQPEGQVAEPIQLRRATFGWPGREPLYRDLEFSLDRGMRVAVLGANGSGKSTFLHAVAGKLPLTSGQWRLGKDVRVGVFTQDLAQDLPRDRSGLDVVLERAPRALPQQARSALGALGLSGDKALRPIHSLSGGEKARVALASFVLTPHDVLLLDEPTNHLDLVSVDVLAEAMAAFEGSIVFVTHDRFLVERLATHLVRVGPAGFELFSGLRPEYFDIRPVNREENLGPSKGIDDHEERKRRQRERERKSKRVDVIQRELEKIETQMANIDSRLVELATNYAKVTALAAERDGLEDRQASLFEEWETLDRELRVES